MKKITLLFLLFSSISIWSQTGGNGGNTNNGNNGNNTNTGSGGTTILGSGGGTGIENISTYPNPAGQNLTISTIDSSASISGYSIQNSSQVAVLSQSTSLVNSVTVDVSSLPQGTYTLHVFINNDRNNPVVKQIVKQ